MKHSNPSLIIQPNSIYNIICLLRTLVSEAEILQYLLLSKIYCVYIGIYYLYNKRGSELLTFHLL